MSQTFIDRRVFAVLVSIVAIPVVAIACLAFVSSDGVNTIPSLDGFAEILTPLRMKELFKISFRAFVVCISATGTSFLLAFILVHKTSKAFQSFFFILITLPFLANESVRVFSWQFLLSEDGFFNQALSRIISEQITLFNGTNEVNVYVVMISTCIPFAVFINSAALGVIPDIYWRVSKDLKLTSVDTIFKVALPLSKFGLGVSVVITFFISFSLSSEVNLLAGDSKISLRNLILSLMSASKFQSIFSLGFGIIVVMVAFIYVIKLVDRKKNLV